MAMNIHVELKLNLFFSVRGEARGDVWVSVYVCVCVCIHHVLNAKHWFFFTLDPFLSLFFLFDQTLKRQSNAYSNG